MGEERKPSGTSEKLSQILTLSAKSLPLGRNPKPQPHSPLLAASLPSSARYIFERRLPEPEKEEVQRLVTTKRDADEDSFSMEHRVESGQTTGGGTTSQSTSETRIDIENGSVKKSERPPRSAIKISLHEIVANQALEKHLSDSSDDEEKEEDKNTEVKSDNKSGAGNFWEKFGGKKARGNKVGASQSSLQDRNLRSAKQIRDMRKKVSVTSQGKKKTTQEVLAMAIVEGDMLNVEDILGAYVSLHGADGFRTVLRFRYDMDPRTLVITCIENPLADQQISSSEEGVAVDIYKGLSALHIACAFDQEHIISYFYRYSNNINKTFTPSGQSLLHTCAYFGTAAPVQVLVNHGASVWLENANKQQPIHLAALTGKLTCLKILIKAGADLEAQDKVGNTPLHAAVLNGHYECVQELLNYDVDPNRKNNENGVPLHYASNVPLVTLLIANGADPRILLDDRDSENRTAFNQYLEAMPEGCQEVLSKYVQSNGKSLGAMDLELKYGFDLFYDEFERNPQKGETALLTNIVKVDQRDLLKHPATETFLHIKWLLVMRFFHAYIFFYSLFIAFLTTHVLLMFSPITNHFDTNIKDQVAFWFHIAASICITILAIKNAFLLIYNFKLYIKTVQNYVEISLVVTCASYLVCFVLIPNYEATVHLAATAVFLAWFNFTLLLGKLPFGGIYINMIMDISRDVLKFMMLYGSTLVAFGLAFHVVSHNHDQFEDPLSAILCTLAMMVGEIGFTDLFINSQISYHWTTQLLFVLQCPSCTFCLHQTESIFQYPTGYFKFGIDLLSSSVFNVNLIS